MKQRGVTLVELVITITIVAIAVCAVLANLAATSRSSAQSMVRHQATAIAEAYLEEIELRPFTDPDGVDGETARASLDDVDDYNGLNDAVTRDQFGNAIAGLDSYAVTVTTQTSSALTGVPAASALRIEVTVTHTSGERVRLTAYRTNY